MSTFTSRRPKASSRDSQENSDKEKVDRQLASQSSSSPFMSMNDGYVYKKVTFDTQNCLEEKIDRLTTMMSKFTIKDNEQNKQFKSKT